MLAILVGLAGGKASARTYYVDAGCPKPGNGKSATCSSRHGGDNPKNTVPEGIAHLSKPGDVLAIRGPHSAHDGCPGHDGVYRTNRFTVSGKRGKPGDPIIIQGYDDGNGRVERPVFEGAQMVAWVHCSTCDAGDHAACRDVPGECAEYWYFTDPGSSTYNRAFACVKTDGTPCYRVPSTGVPANDKQAMTNAHAGYISKVCEGVPWLKCLADADCPDRSDCSGTTAEVDSYGQEKPHGYVVTRWAAEPRGAVLHDSAGMGFDIVSSSWLTLRGLAFRDFRRGGVRTGPACENIVISDNWFAYSLDIRGSDYLIVLDRSDSVTVSNNYFAYSGSEAIHTMPGAKASVFMIRDNFIRDVGETGALGTRCTVETCLTPSCMILSYSAPGTPQDNTGSEVSGNTCLRIAKQGILVEKSRGWSLHDNYIASVGRAAIKLATGADGGDITGVSIHNNVLADACRISSDGSIWISRGTKNHSISGIDIHNNVIYSTNRCPGLLGSGLEAGQLNIRSNVFFSSVDGDSLPTVIDWPFTLTTGRFDNNVFFTAGLAKAGCMSADPICGDTNLVLWKGERYSCATLRNVGESNECRSAGYRDLTGSDFRLYPGPKLGPTAPGPGAPIGGSAGDDEPGTPVVP